LWQDPRHDEEAEGARGGLMELEIGERSNKESGDGTGGLEATGGMRDGGMDGVRKEIGGDPMVEVMESAGMSDKESDKESGKEGGCGD